MNNVDEMRKYANILNENYRADMMDEFTRAYMQAILWAETDQSDDQGGEPLDANYDITDFSAEALRRIKKDCDAFQQQANLDEIPTNHNIEEMAGHDFWLTRVGHGAGFWDGDWPEPYDTKLTELSEKFGNVDVYVGDNGELELM
jgi:hypothetical protein